MTTAAAPSRPSPRAPGAPWLAVHLPVSDVATSAAFYQKALGFTLEEHLAGQDGKMFHAQIRYQDSVVMLGLEDTDSKTPDHRGGATMNHYLYVDLIDDAFERALDAGARPIRSPRNEFWGDRCALIADPDGHLWMLAAHLANYQTSDAWRERKEELANEVEVQMPESD